MKPIQGIFFMSKFANYLTFLTVTTLTRFISSFSFVGGL